MTSRATASRPIPSSYRSRIFRRHRLDLRIKLFVPSSRPRNPALIHGRSRDLSYGGIGIVLTQPVAHGTPAMLVFRVPVLDIEIALPAVVTHRAGSRYGLRFVQLSAEQKLLIQRICRALPA